MTHVEDTCKLPDGDYWLFQARIKYADKDVSVPLPLEVKWAGGHLFGTIKPRVEP